MSSTIPHNHPSIPNEKLGVLIVHLGTPNEPTPKSIRRFLREFLSDPRVIDTPQWRWQIILNAFILPFRPYRIKSAYQSIWNPHKHQSPLRVHADEQIEALQPLFAKHNIHVLDRLPCSTFD